jgi:hypothetical protein
VPPAGLQLAPPWDEAIVNLSEAFRQNADGSWSCVAPVTLDHPKGRVQVTPGTTFARGTRFMGIDVAEWLDQAIAQYAARRPD